MPVDPDVLGKGIAYPMRISASGGTERAREAEKVRESLLILLGTQHGERVMRPAFGCNLQALVFAPNNTSTADLARHYVEEALTRWEPRITLRDVRVENRPSEGALLIHIHYELKSTLEPQNLVYPFYLDVR